MRAEARTPVTFIGLVGVWCFVGLGLAGCSPYQLQGVVVAGEASGVEVVKKNDPRLADAGPGVAGAGLWVVLDPERLSPELIGEGNTDAAGEFALTIDEPGAGFLMLDIELQTKRQDYTSVAERMQLPGSNERVIVTLTRGEDPRRLEAGNVLEETLRDAEPYLRD
ncbi:MAG: hypothetical protein AAGF84_12295 [Planctomycetota bacterium]